MREALDQLSESMTARRPALDEAGALLSRWRAELDAGEPWSEDPLPCAPEGADSQ